MDVPRAIHFDEDCMEVEVFMIGVIDGFKALSKDYEAFIQDNRYVHAP
jgi:hypothetical protein